MMRKFAELSDGIVISVGEGPDDWTPDLPSWAWIPAGIPVVDGWTYDAATRTFRAPASPTWTQADYVRAVQAALDAWAQSRNYDGILSLCSYANSTNPKFNAEGKCGVTARDAAWAYAYGYLHDVETGKRPLMSPAELLKELPPFKWPES